MSKLKSAFIEGTAQGTHWTLIDADLNPVVENSPHKDFRGDEDIITGGTPPADLGKVGYVLTVDGCLYYASVFSLKWVESDTLQPAPISVATPHHPWLHALANHIVQVIHERGCEDFLCDVLLYGRLGLHEMTPEQLAVTADTWDFELIGE